MYDTQTGKKINYDSKTGKYLGDRTTEEKILARMIKNDQDNALALGGGLFFVFLCLVVLGGFMVVPYLQCGLPICP